MVTSSALKVSETPSVCELARQALAHGVHDPSYSTPCAFMRLPHDEVYADHIWQQVHEKRARNYDLCVVIGMGGSQYGAQALWHVHEDCTHMSCQVIWYDTLEPDVCDTVVARVQSVYRSGGRVLFVIISKSGTTRETRYNAAVCLACAHEAYPDSYHEDVVCISDPGSPLSEQAERSGYTFLPIPPSVGGRYSFLSAVGMFPLGVLGCDVTAIYAGARDAVSVCTADNPERNVALQRACAIYNAYTSGCTTHTMLFFDFSMFHFGLWVRQLYAESLGKQRRNGSERVGIFPDIAFAPPDLHSMAQLYFGGPPVRFTTLYRIEQHSQMTYSMAASFVDEGVSYRAAFRALCYGVAATYRDSGMPHATLACAKTPYDLGYLMYLHMCEVVYLGYLLDVNPFDQPAVEAYKQNVRKELRSA